MEKINWKRKLTSRKFWAAVVGFVTALLLGFGVSESETAEIAGIIMAGATLIAYILGEGLVDASAADEAGAAEMLKSRDISRLRADVAENCRIFLERCKAEGLNVLVTETVRDAEYQAQLYARGRTAPGRIVTQQKTPSFHAERVGLAFDVAKNVKGHEYDDAAFFKRCGAIGKRVGFTWGGDWTRLPDAPHFQWDDHGAYTAAMVRAGKLPPNMPRCGEVKRPVTKDEAKNVLRTKAHLSEATLVYLDSYRWGDELLVKLAEAMQ